jgi:hypothetical protein
MYWETNSYEAQSLTLLSGVRFPDETALEGSNADGRGTGGRASSGMQVPTSTEPQGWRDCDTQLSQTTSVEFGNGRASSVIILATSQSCPGKRSTACKIFNWKRYCMSVVQSGQSSPDEFEVQHVVAGSQERPA